MFGLVILLALAAFFTLVFSLMTGSVLIAWGSVVLAMAGAALQLYDYRRRHQESYGEDKREMRYNKYER